MAVDTKSAPRPPIIGPSGRRGAPNAAQVLANARRASRGIKVGKPSSYSPALCERAVALGKRGHSWAGIAREFNISRSTLNDWERQFPAFADALARARAAAQAWWENHGRKNLKADRYQAQVHKNIMAAQFEDYREQRQGDTISAMTDFLQAVTAAAQGRALPVPGDDAKPVQAVDLTEESASEPKR
jgi:hypothetical protein